MVSIFENPGKWFRDTGKAIERDWRNAGRGEIGRWASGVGQSAYNVVVAVPNAVRTGDWDKNVFQKGVFSAVNLASYGTLDYAGQSRGIQKAIGKDPIIGENIAAFARVTRGGGRSAQISNADRNLSVQGAVKAAAAYGGYVGAKAAYGWWTAPSATEGASLASIGAESGRGIGVLQAPAYGSSGAGVSTTAISSANLAPASSGGFFSSSFWQGTKSFGGELLKTTIASRLLSGGGRGGGSDPFIGAPGFNPTITFEQGAPGYGGGADQGYYSPEVGDTGLGKVLLIGALAVGALVIYKVVRK